MWHIYVFIVLPYCLALGNKINACDEAVDIFPCMCTVTNGKLEVDCSGNRLRTVPEYLPKHVSTLDFSNNLLQPNTIDSLCNYDYLEHVSIAKNHLTSIEPKQLTKCTIKKSLVLSDNHFNAVNKFTLYGLEFTPVIRGYEAREFQENTFSDMSGLKSLEMITHQNSVPPNLFKNNRIERLNINFNGATLIPKYLVSPLNKTLSDLTIQSNSIQTLPKELLNHLEILDRFSLKANDLRSIPSTLFQSDFLYNSIRNISLSGIKSLPRYMFLRLEHLRHLEIHETVDMPSDLFSGLPRLESLDLSECFITKIPDNLFNDLRFLRTLNLHNTGLTVIRKDDIKDLHSLQNLDLSNNRLRSLGSNLFHSISESAKYINISDNILKKVPNNLFKQDAVLERLDISENQIYSIERKAFNHLTDLKRLHLQSNKLNKIHSATFVYNVNMTYLDISSNILIDLPVGLLGTSHSLLVFNLSDNRISNLGKSITLYAPTLREINFAYNPVKCDCGIRTVKKLLPNALIIGDCYNTQWRLAIVDFPDTNCSEKSDAQSFIINFVSETKQLHSSKNYIKWNTTFKYSVSTKLLNSILPISTLDSLSYLENEKTALWINSTDKITPSESINLHDLPIAKYSLSEFDAILSDGANFSFTPAHDTIKPSIVKSTSVTVNNSQVDSDDNTLGVNANKIHTDHLSRVSIKITKTEIVTTKADFASASTIRDKKSLAIALEPEPEINRSSSSSNALDVTLEPSFREPNGAYFQDYPLNETLHTKTFLLENDLQNSEFVSLISPTSVYSTGAYDDQTMTDVFHNLSETIEHSTNAIAFPPSVGYGNITSYPETDEMEQRTDYFYLSLGSIISVAVLSVLILVLLYVKRRRSDAFIMGTRRSANIYTTEESFTDDDIVSNRESLCPMKDVPSIQIETVDDDGNVKLEYYTGPNNTS